MAIYCSYTFKPLTFLLSAFSFSLSNSSDAPRVALCCCARKFFHRASWVLDSPLESACWEMLGALSLDLLAWTCPEATSLQLLSFSRGVGGFAVTEGLAGGEA